MRDFSVYEAMNKLKLPEDERELIMKRSGVLYESFGVIKDIDTSGVDPLITVLEMQNVFRQDECTKEISREELLASAPDHDRGYYRVPKTLEG